MPFFGARYRLKGGLVCCLFLLSACATPGPDRAQIGEAGRSVQDLPAPLIIASARPTQCVPHARKLSGLAIRGDAWTWWSSGKRKYHRGKTPSVGAVLVLSKTKRLKDGHLSVVTHVLNDREIVVEHANWLNRGQIHKYQRVRDVSKRGDWSAVKVWYTPGQVLGSHAYAVSGFIYSHTG